MNTSNTSQRAEQKVPFYINRNFALLWGGQAISNLGDFVFDTTLILWIATVIARGQSWAPLAVSAVLLVTSLPTFIFGPIAGVFVDRWDKRKTMLRMDILRAILIALLVLITGIIPLPFPPSGRLPVSWQLASIYTIVFLATLCAQFFNPARFALIGDVVDEPLRPRASGLGQVTMNIAVIIGPPLAAPLLFTIGVQWALVLNALSFVVSFLAVSFVRVPRQLEKDASTQKNFLRELGEGLHFFVQSRPLMTILITAIIATLGVGALNALDVFFVTQNLHVSANLYGLIGTAFGLGSIIGAIFASMFGQRFGVTRTFWLGFLIAGLLILAYSRLTSFPPALLLFFFIGVTVTGGDAVLGPLLLHITPHELVGRVISVFAPSTSLASMISIALAGYLTSTILHNFHATLLGFTFGSIDTIFMATGLLVILGALYAMINLRNVYKSDEKSVSIQEKSAIEGLE